MTRIRLLANAGDYTAGEVVEVNEARAERLIRTGYATAAPPEERVSRKKDKE